LPTRKPSSSSTPSDVPASSDRPAFSTEEIGFTLKSDEKTLREIDEINEEAVKAAQANKKFAWR
jgi:hypothetical protein